jgi:hypothetical protein
MSSETSTDLLQPWQLFTLAGLIGATVVVLVSRGQTPAGIILLSLTIFTAAIVGVAAWRTLIPFARKEQMSGLPVIGGRTRAALEREKALVLRSIKELEFDRAMGKLSEKDFVEMSGRLRARAVGLLRRLDAGEGYRDLIEQEIAKRLKSDAVVGRTLSGPPGEPHKARPTTTVNTCVSCETNNDADARFCKNCGKSLEPTS